MHRPNELELATMHLATGVTLHYADPGGLKRRSRHPPPRVLRFVVLLQQGAPLTLT